MAYLYQPRWHAAEAHTDSKAAIDAATNFIFLFLGGLFL
jgi:hypothetical protein